MGKEGVVSTERSLIFSRRRSFDVFSDGVFSESKVWVISVDRTERTRIRKERMLMSANGKRGVNGWESHVIYGNL